MHQDTLRRVVHHYLPRGLYSRARSQCRDGRRTDRLGKAARIRRIQDYHDTAVSQALEPGRELRLSNQCGAIIGLAVMRDEIVLDPVVLLAGFVCSTTRMPRPAQ